MRYIFGEFALDTQRHALRRAGRVGRRRRNAFQVLAYLLAHPDRIVSKQELCEQVWPQQFISDAALESTIKAVRQAIGDSGRDQGLLQTVHGCGYRWLVAVETYADAWADLTDEACLAPHEQSACPQKPLGDAGRAGGRNAPTCQCRRRSGGPHAMDLVWPKL
jgi:DNA-binding winged helix-turn-helix (wHTH) protein